VVALYENGEHGDRASWIVRDVLKAYFDKKERLARGQQQITESIRPPLLLPFSTPAALLFGNGIPK
jgi:penicillin-binding protein 2